VRGGGAGGWGYEDGEMMWGGGGDEKIGEVRIICTSKLNSSVHSSVRAFVYGIRCQ
jgi:hypothetical protein